LAAKATKTSSTPVSEKKVKVEKEKRVGTPYVNNTPKGEKKGKHSSY